MKHDVKIKEDKKGQEVNIGTSSYGMKNVIMSYVETEEWRCEKSECQNHNPEDCLDCHDIDYWTCSGCCYDDETVHFYGPTYSLKCDCCGAGFPQSY